MIEIERKFLVSSKDFKTEAVKQYRIKQGYISRDPERTVRIRISNTKAFITVKGKTSEDGTSRFEWEKEIDLPDAQNLIKLCEGNLIEKIRYHINIENHEFVVDEFLGSQEGLILAEIELSHPNEKFQKPKWLADEVTGQPKYYNASM